MLVSVTLILLPVNILSTVSLTLGGTKHLKFIYKNDVGATPLLRLYHSKRASCDNLELSKVQNPTIFTQPLLQFKRTGIIFGSRTDLNLIRVRITCVASYPINLYAQRNSTSNISVISTVSATKDKLGYSYNKSFEITTSSLIQAKLLFKCSPVSCHKDQFQSVFEISIQSGQGCYTSILNGPIYTVEGGREKDITRKIIYCSLLGSLIIVTSIVLLVISLFYQLECRASLSDATKIKKPDSEKKQTDDEFVNL